LQVAHLSEEIRDIAIYPEVAYPAGIVLQVLKDDSNSTEHVQWHKINKGGKH